MKNKYYIAYEIDYYFISTQEFKHYHQCFNSFGEAKKELIAMAKCDADEYKSRLQEIKKLRKKDIKEE